MTENKFLLPDTPYFVTEKIHGLDFSVNTNPLGLPTGIKDVLLDTANLNQYYPDPQCRQLTAALSKKYSVSPDNILCGNGADDLIYRLVFALRPQKAIIIQPTFEEYEKALNLIGCQIEHYNLCHHNDFLLDKTFLSTLTPDIDIIFLCNPNNPTGQLVPTELLHSLLMYCEVNNILLVVDECFMGFIPESSSITAKQHLSDFHNLIVIDAFTKLYSLAGFRLGFCMSINTLLLDKIYAAGQGWSVSVPAQIAGIVSLSDTDYLNRTYELIDKERYWLIKQLNLMQIYPCSSKANFLFFQSPMENLAGELRKCNIKVRDCSKFYGLKNQYCRIAIKQHDDNIMLIKALKRILI